MSSFQVVKFCILCTVSVRSVIVSELYTPYIIIVSSRWYILLHCMLAFCPLLPQLYVFCGEGNLILLHRLNLLHWKQHFPIWKLVSLLFCVYCLSEIWAVFYLYHLPMCHRLYGYSTIFVSGKVVCMVQFSCNIS